MTDEKSEFITHLCLASAQGGEPIQLTYDEHANRCPRWSPDGRYVKFLHLVEEPRLLLDVVRRATDWLNRWIGR
jgi:Tol biopolymer transport system component